MKKIRLEIAGITYSQTQSGSYVLTLAEVSGKRKLPIVIGGFEAQAIAIELEKMAPNRPLTHDLFKSFCEAYNVMVTEVIIYKFHEGVFYAKIICIKENEVTEIDSRTSDAIAIGVRFNCPIYSYNSVLDEVGNTKELGEFDEDDDSSDEDNIEQLELDDPFNHDVYSDDNDSIEELQNKLKEAIEREEYELASRLRDEIAKRSLK
jgi:bifunctional DNase/RNase